MKFLEPKVHPWLNIMLWIQIQGYKSCLLGLVVQSYDPSCSEGWGKRIANWMADWSTTLVQEQPGPPSKTLSQSLKWKWKKKKAEGGNHKPKLRELWADSISLWLFTRMCPSTVWCGWRGDWVGPHQHRWAIGYWLTHVKLVTPPGCHE